MFAAAVARAAAARRPLAAATAAAFAAATAVAAVAGDAAAAAPTPPSDTPELLTERLSPRDALATWRRGSTLDRLNREDPADVDPRRRVLVVVGITGAGKSSTANTLAGRSHAPFELSSSVKSVTQAVSHRDYDFLNTPYRVIDTPGLCDTHKPPGEVYAELARLARYTPHGVSAFVLVVPRGRFTWEQESALRQLVGLLGEGAKAHAVLAVTSATEGVDAVRLIPRDVLLDEINALPLGHFYRRLVEELRLRVVPVENRLEPHRQLSRMALHQRVLDVEAATGGARYDTSRFLDPAGGATAVAAAMAAAAVGGGGAQGGGGGGFRGLEGCAASVAVEGDGYSYVTIRCRVAAGESAGGGAAAA